MNASFNGTSLVIWFTDGKIKYKIMSDQEKLAKEVERLKAVTPNRAMAVFAINWDSDEILPFIGEEPE